MIKTQFLDTDAAFALRVKQLQDRISDQMSDALIESGLKLNAKTTGIVQLLYSEGPCSKAYIAHRLRYSHQLASQRLSWLLTNDMAVTEADATDRRHQNARLTKAGMIEAKKLQRFLPKLRHAYKDLFIEIGIDLDASIAVADQALEKRSLSERLSSGKKPP